MSPARQDAFFSNRDVAGQSMDGCFKRNAVGAGRCLQGRQGVFEIGIGQVGHALLFGEIALACQ
jgi:hypothetical protein